MKKEYIVELREKEADELMDANWVSELVRCKDCDNKECEGHNGYIVCGITGESHPPTWFCASGERRESE